MSHSDPTQGISSLGDGNSLNPINYDLDSMSGLMPLGWQPDVQVQTGAFTPTTTVDQLVSLADAPLPLPYFGFENAVATPAGGGGTSTSNSGVLAGIGALLAPQECEPGDLPNMQMARSVIHRNSDSGEVAVESLLSPPELNLADLWLKSGQNDWMNLDQLPNGHPRRLSRLRGPRPPQVSRIQPQPELEHKKHTSGDLQMASLLTLLTKTLKDKPKQYVTGLRGELLEAGDEQLLGNTDVMVLPYSPPPPFTVEEETKAERAKREKEDREKANLLRWRERKRKKSAKFAGDGKDDSEDDDEMPAASGYLNFDVFDFFEKLLSKNAP